MPGNNCSVFMCKSNALISKRAGDQVRFFTFPKDLKLRKEWVRKCHRPDEFNPKFKRVCSKHFDIEDFEDAIEAQIQNRLPKILKRNCLPSLNLKPEKILSEAKKNRLKRPAKKKQKEIINEIVKEDMGKGKKSDISFGASAHEVTIGHGDIKIQGENVKGAAARYNEVEKKISQFISPKVQIVIAKLL